jgi:putative nucleotidyltransferase with HDIG domain
VTSPGPASSAAVGSRPGGFLHRLRLRPMVFVLLLSVGVLPLLISSTLLIRRNRELLVTEEKRYLTQSAQSLSRELNDHLLGVRRQLHQLGATLLALPGNGTPQERLRAAWVGNYLHQFIVANPNLRALRVLTPDGTGPRLAPPDLPEALSAALDQAFDTVYAEQRPVWRFAVASNEKEPVAALGVPVHDEDGQLLFVVEAITGLRIMEAVFEREATGRVEVFLIGPDGRLLWSEGADLTTQSAIARSDLVRDFVRKPLLLAAQYPIDSESGAIEMLGHVSPVEDAGWGIVIQKPVGAAFEAARRMVTSAVLAAVPFLVAALGIATIVSGRIGATIRQLTQTTHEIAAGNFGRRLEERRMVSEVADLASDFNRMSGHVEEHVQRLREAAKQNRDLFISSIRAFAAAIDAKDPYTRGHSERVADLARSIARHLAQSEEFQQKIWIGALLHDVGKIGVEDKVLRKGGVLTAEEFELMKAHPTIGAEILAPIKQLEEMLPVVRWHHENWNGRGYPDGLRGEAIPLAARIVAVADSYDAVTTDRPYQKAYEPRFAAEVITKLAGSRFDAKVVTAFLRAFELGDLVQHVREHGHSALEVELPVSANV